MPYAVFERRPGEWRGHNASEDYYSIKDARELLKEMAVQVEDGTYLVIKYARPGYEGGTVFDHPLEAYVVKEGIPHRARYETWEPSLNEKTELLTARLGGVPEYSKLEKDTYKKSREGWIGAHRDIEKDIKSSIKAQKLLEEERSKRREEVKEGRRRVRQETFEDYDNIQDAIIDILRYERRSR